MNFAPWTAANKCVGGARPGATHLLAWLLENYRPPGRSGGIYSCRTIAGTKNYSVHSEGRAIDFFMPVGSNGRGTAAGEAIVKRLGAQGNRLGIQVIIYNKRLYSRSSPGGRNYTGAHPHYDHIHIELTRTAGENLTLATVRSVLGTSTQTTQSTTTSTTPTIRQGSSGAAVRTAQGRLNVHIRAGVFSHAILSVDGAFGPLTDTATRRFQRARGLSQDGIIGRDTWAELNKEPQPAARTKLMEVTARSNLNVRSGASTRFAVVRSLRSGAVVSVDSVSNGWARLSAGGFASASYLRDYRGPAPVTYTVTASALNLRTGPGTNHTSAGTLRRGAKVSVLSISGGWARLASGFFVASKYITR